MFGALCELVAENMQKFDGTLSSVRPLYLQIPDNQAFDSPAISKKEIGRCKRIPL